VRVAVPVADGRLVRHFGHCEEFMAFDADTEADSVGSPGALHTLPHGVGFLPERPKDEGGDIAVAGGTGRRAQRLFAQIGVGAIAGAACDDPRAIVQDRLSGGPVTGDAAGDHGVPRPQPWGAAG
jgi:predicted Fe-Mo cluster-binding NifX family protein